MFLKLLLLDACGTQNRTLASFLGLLNQMQETQSKTKDSKLACPPHGGEVASNCALDPGTHIDIIDIHIYIYAHAPHTDLCFTAGA